ncbi:hypothetical protein GCM10010918_50540 [Paenibacillus radicis (ex Gao et al. 2016)]|uniref:Uncharacterized protein n=1 Tax=Paenibacillus radicis (ex Gao et al. 2016) TaxID=1737354 RepID=A0A917M9L9_9BACL|nr:hypothetical protein GCM10010918_50540 [Paenibacillus radicis (ex Gao et al. 2016)]
MSQIQKEKAQAMKQLTEQVDGISEMIVVKQQVWVLNQVKALIKCIDFTQWLVLDFNNKLVIIGLCD